MKHPFIIVAAAIAIMLPAFILGPGGADLHCQDVWARLFSAQFWQGNIYPRWLMDMFAGAGAPVFFYYPPLAYWIGALFSAIPSPDIFYYYPLMASATLATATAGLTFYGWAKQEAPSPAAALAGSLLYMLAPAHTAQDIYYLTMYSSSWAYAWAPLLMWSSKNLALGKPHATAAVGGSLALLILTNIPATVIFSTLAGAYGVLYFSKSHWRMQLARFAAAALLGLGLSAVYWLPTFFYAGWVNLSWILRAPHWLEYSVWGIVQSYNAYFLFTSLLMIIYGVANRKKSPTLFFIIATAISLALMLPTFNPLWEHFPFNIVQMRERLFLAPALCMAMSAALHFTRLRWLAYITIALYAAATLWVAGQTRMNEATFRERFPLRYEMYQRNIDQYPTYLPGKDLMLRYGTAPGLKAVDENKDHVKIVDGNGATTIERWQPRSIALHYEGTDATLRIRQFYFPGWYAEISGRPTAVSRDADTGFIRLNVPGGSHEIVLRLEPLPPEIVGKVISLIATALLLLWMLTRTRTRT